MAKQAVPVFRGCACLRDLVLTEDGTEEGELSLAHVSPSLMFTCRHVLCVLIFVKLCC